MFKTFPEFSKLTLEDKIEYEALIKHYPPIADISFAGLMTWWSNLANSAIAMLNGNLVISYWLPGDEKNSGLSLIGAKEIDTSVCTIFDHLISKDEPVRLVHVPDFVVSSMRCTKVFRFEPEPDYDESIYSNLALSSIEKIPKHRRSKIERFIKAAGRNNIKLRRLDLRVHENQEVLLGFIADDDDRADPYNLIAEIEGEVLLVAIRQAATLGIENLCIYINDKLYAFLMYELPADDSYVIVTFACSNSTIPGSAEFLSYAFARWFSERGIPYTNYEQDLGSPAVRAEKLSMGLTNYFREYTVMPNT